MTKTSFAGLGIVEPLVAKLADYGITEPSPVQAECIPAALEGRDILAGSQTGTGKTLAFLLPLLQKIDTGDKSLQGLILAPTQELAIQIQREAEKYGEVLGVNVQALIGGAAMKRQLERLRLHPQLVVGTPGRIREILALRKLKLHKVHTVVVDEVDQMFQLGGTGDLEQILRGTLRDRQLMFLSATIDQQIHKLAEKEMKDPVRIGIEPEQRTSKSLEHLYFTCEEREKIDMLRRIIRQFDSERSIVFINNTDHIAEVEAKLNHVGLLAGALYGDADKATRSVTLKRFREGKIKVLVASDVAARGLDIEELGLVINLDPPIDSEHYVHRVGRTGRMGRQGLAVSIITNREEFIIRKFSRELGIDIKLRRLYGGKVIDPSSAETGSRNGGRVRSTDRSKSSDRTVRTSNSSRELGSRGSIAGPLSTKGERQPNLRSDSPGLKDSAQGKLTAGRKKERNQDSKNKGAPKWLKEKASHNKP